MITQAAESVLDLATRRGVIRPRDVVAAGLPRQWIYRLHKRGLLERVGRGLYRVPGAKVTASHSLAEVARRVPKGVVCLLSALQFHQLTTQLPHEVWVAIDVKAWKPKDGDLPVRVVRFSGKALTAGVEHHDIEGVDVMIYSPAKTVADCFKYRHKIGLDVALEALRDLVRARQGSMDELWRFAEICRVANVMRPYLEATT
jgi:predicted transcriptional regulator of viral defense system